MNIQQLLENLDYSLVEITDIYKVILSALERQRAALVSRDESALSTATSEISSLLQSANQAEAKRDQNVLALADLFSAGNTRPTLKDVVAMAEHAGQDEMARSLAESHLALINILAAVREVHDGNAAIIQRRLAYSRFMMGMLSRGTGYGADGTRKVARMSRVSIEA